MLRISASTEASESRTRGILLVVATCDVVDSHDGIGRVLWPRVGLVVGRCVRGCWYASYPGGPRLECHFITLVVKPSDRKLLQQRVPRYSITYIKCRVTCARMPGAAQLMYDFSLAESAPCEMYEDSFA